MSCVIENTAKLDMSKICLKENGQKVDIAKAYLIENGQKHLLWSGALNMFYTVNIVKNSPKVAFSSDGINWESHSDITLDGKSTGYYFSGLCYGNGVIVASLRYRSSNRTALAYSTDGINYHSTGIEYTCSYDYYPDPRRIDLCYGNGTFLASCKCYGDVNTSKTFYSKDGKTWTQCREDAYHYKFLNGQFVQADGTLATNRLYSTDGITWGQKTSSSTYSYYMHDLTYFNGRYVAIVKLSSGAGRFAYSSDLESWTTQSTSLPYAYSAESNDEIAVFVGAAYDTTDGDLSADACYSTNGVSGTKGTGLVQGVNGDSEKGTGPYAHLVYHDGLWLCGRGNIFNDNNNIYNDYAYSYDGKTWTEYEIWFTNANGTGSGIYCAGIVYAGEE